MRLLHVSDLHIGKRLNGVSLLDDQRHILRQILDIAKQRQAKALLIAGDIYDKASPSAEAVTVFDAFLTDVVAAGLRVLAIPGNHDSAERIAYAQGLLESQGVCFPPVYAGEVERVVLEDEWGDVAFWLLPFLKPGDVRRYFPDVEIGGDYSAALRAVLGACEIDANVRNVVLSHQLVTAYGVSPDRADDEIKLGGIDNVDVSVYDAFDYVALGHVHRPQRVGRDTVRYSGSPLKYSFSEARYNKSVVLVDLGEKLRLVMRLAHVFPRSLSRLSRCMMFAKCVVRWERCWPCRPIRAAKAPMIPMGDWSRGRPATSVLMGWRLVVRMTFVRQVRQVPIVRQ